MRGESGSCKRTKVKGGILKEMKDSWVNPRGRIDPEGEVLSLGIISIYFHQDGDLFLASDSEPAMCVSGKAGHNMIAGSLSLARKRSHS